jgi:hypothetical protein
MKKLLYKYLNAYYVLDNNGRNYAIFKNENGRLVSQYNDKIVKELVELFGYGYTRTLWCIDSWAKTIIPHVNLNYYWRGIYLDDTAFSFPTVRSVSASLLGTDLVRVEPISGPTGQLFYMDYIISSDPITPDSEIIVNRVDSMRIQKENTLRKWSSLGFLEGLSGHVKDNMVALYESQARQLLE